MVAKSEAPTSIRRYTVPVDGEWHVVELQGRLLHVATRDIQLVEFWATFNEGEPVRRHTLKVVGTGEEYPWHCGNLGTALTPSGRLVWHLIESTVPQS